MKNEQIQAKNDYQEARTNLIKCSYFDEPDKWNILLDIALNLA